MSLGPKAASKRMKREVKKAVASAESRGNENLLESNRYLMMLLDPIDCTPTSYPDEYLKQTACFKSLSTLYVPVNTTIYTSTPNNWPIGSYHVNVNPEFQFPIRYLTNNSNAEFFTGMITENTAHSGLLPESIWSGTGVTPVRRIDDPDLQLEQNIWYNIWMPLSTEECSYCPMFHGENTSSALDFFGIPTAGAGTGASYRVTFTPMVVGGATSFEARTVGPSGTGVASSVIPGTPGNALSLTPATITYDTPPGVGIQIRAVGGTSPTVMSNISLRLGCGTGNHVIWRESPIPNLETADSIYDSYRVVSMGALLSYRGPTLNNGGSCAAVLYRGGHDPGVLGLQDWGTLTEIPMSQENAIVQGSYGVWLPADPVDMSFRATASGSHFEMPYLAFSGIYTGDGSGTVISNILRLRVAINFECTSPSQVVPQVMSRPDLLDERKRATLFLEDFKPVMENPLHWDKIRDVLHKAVSTAVGAGKKAMSFYDRNKEWIVPAASAAGTALLAI